MTKKSTSYSSGISRETNQIDRNDGGEGVQKLNVSKLNFTSVVVKLLSFLLFIMTTPIITGALRDRGATSRFLCTDYSLNKSYAPYPWGTCQTTSMCSCVYVDSHTESILRESYGKYTSTFSIRDFIDIYKCMFIPVFL